MHSPRAARHARTFHRQISVTCLLTSATTRRNFLLWLAPEQVRVHTISADSDPAAAPLVKYAKDIANELRGQMVRVSTDFGSSPIKAKIQDAEHLRIHTMLVIGGHDMEASAVSVRLHGNGNLGAKQKAEVVVNIFVAIKERRP